MQKQKTSQECLLPAMGQIYYSFVFCNKKINAYALVH